MHEVDNAGLDRLSTVGYEAKKVSLRRPVTPKRLICILLPRLTAMILRKFIGDLILIVDVPKRMDLRRWRTFSTGNRGGRQR